jgi:hypothetical protein
MTSVSLNVEANIRLGEERSNEAMKRTLAVFAIAAALPALAQPPKQAVDTMVVNLVGTIEAIDAAERVVSVNIDGEVYAIAVKPDVKRFGELKVGDKLSAEYQESVLMEVRQPGAAAPAAAAGGDAVRVAGKAVRPSGTVVQQQVGTVLVKAIDHKTPSITVETGDASIVTMKVDHPERLAAVKVGDKIDIKYTRVFTVRLE